MPHKSLDGQTILVTGAGGLIGRLVPPVLRAQGAHVLAHYRKAPADTGALGEAGEPATVLGDLVHGPLSGPPLETVTHVVHLAATLFHSHPAAYYRDNTDISVNLTRTMRDRMPALRQVVHISSLAARGPGDSADYPDPQRDARPVSDYGRSKLASEHILQAGMPQGARLCVLRAGIVLSRDDHRLQALYQRIGLATALVGRRLPRRFSALSDRDLIEAIAAAIGHPEASAGTFDVAHPEPLDLTAITAELGLRMPERHPAEGAPVPWMRWAVGASGLADRLRRRKPMVTGDKLLEMSYAQWVSDPAPFMAATGWRARDVPNAFVLRQIRGE